MTSLRFEFLISEPITPDPHTLYLVKNTSDGFFELHASNNDGSVVVRIPTKTDLLDFINTILAGQMGAADGIASLDAAARLQLTQLPTTIPVDNLPVGVANGIAGLGSDAKVPADQLPSYVDDVVEVANISSLPLTGESGKIYVVLDNGEGGSGIYRWATSAYFDISPHAGTADAALKWATARTLTIKGAVTGSAQIDGSGNVELTVSFSEEPLHEFLLMGA